MTEVDHGYTNLGLYPRPMMRSLYQITAMTVTHSLCWVQGGNRTVVEGRACLDMLFQAFRKVCLLQGFWLEGGGATSYPQVLHIHPSHQTLRAQTASGMDFVV